VEWSFEELGEWQRVSRVGGILCLATYGLFLLYAFANSPGFLFLDWANLMIHEAGHPLFSSFGDTLMLLGGTLLELIVPAACGIYFFLRRHAYGFAFCSLWFFENFLYIGTYMADARTSSLALVGSDTSDWELLFGQWGVLLYDQKIGYTMRALGWLGMLATLAWLAYRTFRTVQAELKPLEM